MDIQKIKQALQEIIEIQKEDGDIANIFGLLKDNIIYIRIHPYYNNYGFDLTIDLDKQNYSLFEVNKSDNMNMVVSNDEKRDGYIILSSVIDILKAYELIDELDIDGIEFIKPLKEGFLGRDLW